MAKVLPRLGANTIALVLILMSIGGCAGSPYRLSRADADELQRANLSDLCFAYIVNDRQHAGIRDELQRRKVFSKREWEAIHAHRIFLGMSEGALLCSWGSTYEDDLVIRRLKSNEGIRKSYAYLRYDSSNWLLNVGIALGSGSSFDTRTNNSTGMWEVPGEWPKVVYLENGIIIGYVEGDAAQRTDCLEYRFEFTSSCLKFTEIDSSLDSLALYDPSRPKIVGMVANDQHSDPEEIAATYPLFCNSMKDDTSPSEFLRVGNSLFKIHRYSEAHDCFSRLVSSGMADERVLKAACEKLGLMYELGWGVEPDLDTAMRWYGKAGLKE